MCAKLKCDVQQKGENKRLGVMAAELSVSLFPLSLCRRQTIKRLTCDSLANGSMLAMWGIVDTNDFLLLFVFIWWPTINTKDFNKIAIQATVQMAADKEAVGLLRVHTYESECILPLRDNCSFSS